MSIESHARAVPWLRRLVTGLSPRRPEFTLVVFVKDKVVLGFLSELFGVLLWILFHHGFPCSYIIWGTNNRPAGGRSSKTWPRTRSSRNTCARSYRKHNQPFSSTTVLKRFLNTSPLSSALLWFRLSHLTFRLINGAVCQFQTPVSIEFYINYCGHTHCHQFYGTKA
jgi:hypothetical protein